MNRHIIESSSLSTEELIPLGKKLFIRRWPRYIPTPLHYHGDAMEVIFLLKGWTVLNVDNMDISMKEGDICFIAPNVLHNLMVYEDDVLIVSLIIYVDMLKEILGDTSLDKDIFASFLGHILYGKEFLPYLFCSFCIDDLILELLLDMIHEQENDSMLTDRYMGMIVGVIFLRLMNKYSDRITFGNTTMKNSVRIAEVIEYAKKHYRSITLQELAERFNYSAGHLSTMIKKSYGRSFSEIISVIKLEKSLEMLKGSERSIADIADELGYGDKSYFFRVFKKKYGMTPTEYRRSRPGMGLLEAEQKISLC